MAKSGINQETLSKIIVGAIAGGVLWAVQAELF